MNTLPQPAIAAPDAGWLPARAAALQQCFRSIAATRMAGLPVVHPGLDVRVCALQLESDEEAAANRGAVERTWAWGLLLTPWFLNLVRVPAEALPASAVPPLDRHARRVLGGREWRMFGCHEPAFGAWEAVSLMSPLHELADPAAAQALIDSVLAQLRPGAVGAAARAANQDAGTPHSQPSATHRTASPCEQPSRRRWLVRPHAAMRTVEPLR